MGVLKFQSYCMYWATATRIPAIADLLSKKEFETIKSYIHFNDNTKMPERGSADYVPIYNVLPFIESLRLNCLKVDPEEKHCVDEIIFPTKTRWSIRQYIPKKWCLKVFARCGVSGFIYDFFCVSRFKINI
jgi:Transposase IS4